MLQGNSAKLAWQPSQEPKSKDVIGSVECVNGFHSAYFKLVFYVARVSRLKGEKFIHEDCSVTICIKIVTNGDQTLIEKFTVCHLQQYIVQQAKTNFILWSVEKTEK